MEENCPKFEIEKIGHLGILAAMAKRINLVKIINGLLEKTSNSHKLSHGNIVLAMIYQGLGLSGNPAYLAESFFEEMPMDKLFKKDKNVGKITANLFNRDNAFEVSKGM
jgi:hypothetical protein